MHRHRPRTLAVLILILVVQRVGVVFLRLHVFTMQLQASHLPTHRPSCCRMMDELKPQTKEGLVTLIFGIYENDPKEVLKGAEQIEVRG